MELLVWQPTKQRGDQRRSRMDWNVWRSRAMTTGKWATIWGLNTAGVIGFLLIAYGYLQMRDPGNWSLPKVDAAATWLSNVITMLGLLITVCSVYFRPHLRPPDWGTHYVVVPVFALPLIAYGVYLLVRFGPLPEHMINGFAIEAIVGGLFRLLPYTEQGNFETTSTEREQDHPYVNERRKRSRRRR